MLKVLSFLGILMHVTRLTYEAKDVPYGGDKDDQGVGANQQAHGDDGVTDPAEVLGGTQELVDGGTNLQRRTSYMNKYIRKTIKIQHRLYSFSTYREKHHGYGEGDGSQHSQADDQQDHVKLEDLGVGVQHLRLHMHCRERQQRHFRPDARPAHIFTRIKFYKCELKLQKC